MWSRRSEDVFNNTQKSIHWGHFMPFSFSDGNSKSHVFAGDQFAALPDVAADGPPGMRHIHIVVLGTGFAGLGMAIHLKQRGYEDFAVLERAAEVGGNWRDNTY